MLRRASLGFAGQLLALVFKDEAKWEEHKHPRDKTGKFTTGAGASKNEKHFSAMGVGGEHKIVSLSGATGQGHNKTVNEYIASHKSKSAALSWLKFYHAHGKVSFVDPPKEEKKLTPLTQGKNAPLFAAKGVTKESLISSKLSSLHGMSVGDFIAKKHAGNEGKALSWLKHYEKHGLASVGHSPQGQAAPPTPAAQVKTDPVFKAGPVTSAIKPMKPSGPTPEEKLAAKEKIKADKAAAKEKAKQLELHKGIEPESVIEAVSSHFKKSYHGKTVKSLTQGMIKSYQSPQKNSNAVKKQADYIKSLANSGSIKLHPPGTQVGEYNAFKATGIKPEQKVVIKSMPGVSYSNTKYAHGLTVAQFLANSEKHHKKTYYQPNFDKDKVLTDLKDQAKAGYIRFADPNEKVAPYDPYTAKGITKEHKISISDPDSYAFRYGTGALLKPFHGKTLHAFQMAHGVDKVEELLQHKMHGKVDIKAPHEQVGAIHDPSAEDKSHWGQADFDRTHFNQGFSHSQYMAEAAKHYQPSYAESSAMASYSGSTYAQLNDALRKGQAPPTQHHANAMKGMDSFIEKSRLKTNHTLFRGTSNKNLYNLLSKLKPGDTYSEGGFLSTSHSKHVAHGFAGGSHKNLFVIRTKAGARAAYMGKHSHFKSEHEVVLPRNAKLKYAGRSKEGHFVFDHED